MRAAQGGVFGTVSSGAATGPFGVAFTASSLPAAPGGPALGGGHAAAAPPAGALAAALALPDLPQLPSLHSYPGGSSGSAPQQRRGNGNGAMARQSFNSGGVGTDSASGSAGGGTVHSRSTRQQQQQQQQPSGEDAVARRAAVQKRYREKKVRSLCGWLLTANERGCAAPRARRARPISCASARRSRLHARPG